MADVTVLDHAINLPHHFRCQKCVLSWSHNDDVTTIVSLLVADLALLRRHHKSARHRRTPISAHSTQCAPSWRTRPVCSRSASTHSASTRRQRCTTTACWTPASRLVPVSVRVSVHSSTNVGRSVFCTTARCWSAMTSDAVNVCYVHFPSELFFCAWIIEILKKIKNFILSDAFFEDLSNAAYI